MGLDRKKPVVEAIRWTGDNIMEIRAFMHPAEPLYMEGYSNADDLVGVYTPEGPNVASKGDWLVKGVEGELHACKPDIFEAFYGPSDDQSMGTERRFA